MHRFRDSANRCWQNIHQKLHVPSDAHKELTMTETEPKTGIEHISEPVKKPIITVFNNNPTSTKLGWGELLRRELSSDRKEATTSLAEIPVNQPLLINLPPELFEQIFSYLPLPSKVCLILSCKGLYQLYNSVLAADELHFPQAPYFWGRPIRNANDGKRLLT